MGIDFNAYRLTDVKASQNFLPNKVLDRTYLFNNLFPVFIFRLKNTGQSEECCDS